LATSDCHCPSLLIGNGIGFRPLDEEVSVSLMAPWEGPCYIDGYSFERGSRRYTDAFGPDSWFGDRTGVLPAPLLKIFSCLESLVLLPDSILGIADTQVTWRSAMYFCST
jgi:hypothetical protein